MFYSTTKSNQNLPLEYGNFPTSIDGPSSSPNLEEKDSDSEEKAEKPEEMDAWENKERETQDESSKYAAGEKANEENLEMIGMKTKVSSSTITSPLEDSTSATFGERSSIDSGEVSVTSFTRHFAGTVQFSNKEFGRDLATESTNSAQVLLPTYASLSTTPKTTARQTVHYYDAVEASRVTSFEETTKGQQESIGSDNFDRTEEIIEPYLLECQNSGELDNSEGDMKIDQVTTGEHNNPHRHGHDNSNYNRYQSNRRRRRWRNNHAAASDTNPLTKNMSTFSEPSDRKQLSSACPTTHKRSKHHHSQRRGIWKVGNWTLCEDTECFTWNTGNL